MRRYPQLFEKGGFPTVGDGWQDLLERALKRFAAAVAREPAGSFQIVQIKEKFATLRLYFHGRQLSKRALAEYRRGDRAGRGAVGLHLRGMRRRGTAVQAQRLVSHALPAPCGRRTGPDPTGMGQSQHRADGLRGKVGVLSCRRYDRERDVFVEAPVPPDFDDEP